MKKEKQLIDIASHIRAIAQTGLVYSRIEYDRERYCELLELSHKITSLVSGAQLEDICKSFRIEDDYVTPKVDVRAVIFNDKDEILLVRESADGLWSLPGGWADVGYSPKEVAVKEVKEETGLNVCPIRLLAVTDKKCHPHPPASHYVYKLFILCEIVDGSLSDTFDIIEKGFFERDEIPPLSEERVLKEQIDLMFDYRNDSQKVVWLD